MDDEPKSGYLFRAPRSTPESRAGRPPEPRTETRPGMIIERDVAVEVAQGDRIRVDVYRPSNAEAAAPIIGWSPYGKHNPAPIAQIYPDSGVRPEWNSPITTFEAPDPEYWVPLGYAIVIADIPGTWYSEGHATYCSPEEARAYADLIEWAGTRSWSNGRVGLSGVSYLTVSQWRVAELNPPHLAAINPWEGWSDTYREVARHGGIPETSFWPYIWERWGAGTGLIEDLETETAEHPWFDEFWASKAAKLEDIRVPAFVVASWSDQGLHTRGTLEGFRRISSEHKWLDIHGRKKWAYYYDPANVERQRAFFDQFLRGVDRGVLDWPRVRMEVRERYYQGTHRVARDWPPSDTEYRSWYLDAEKGALVQDVPDGAAVEYDSLGSAPGPVDARFTVTFGEPTEIVGHSRLVLHVQAPEADDLDLFVALFKIGPRGDVVGFPYYAQFEDGPVAVGWLRASHRERDPVQSTEFLPVLAHRRALPVPREEIVEVEIEILPSGTRFEAGEGLLLIVQGTDVKRYPKPLTYARHENTVNRGPHRIYTGRDHPSHLVLPIVPAASASR
jgi:uncharacterized protein